MSGVGDAVNQFMKGMGKVLIEDTNHNLEIGVKTACLQGDLQVHRIILAGQDDGLRRPDIRALQSR